MRTVCDGCEKHPRVDQMVSVRRFGPNRVKTDWRDVAVHAGSVPPHPAAQQVAIWWRKCCVS